MEFWWLENFETQPCRAGTPCMGMHTPLSAVRWTPGRERDRGERKERGYLEPQAGEIMQNILRFSYFRVITADLHKYIT